MATESYGSEAINQFELYLVSEMRVPLVSLREVLPTLENIGDALAAAKAAMNARGFGTIGERADYYRNCLGPPLSEEPVEWSAAPDGFVGSRALRFRLPLWPSYDFVVNENQSGSAWGVRFERSKGRSVPRLESISDLATWKFVKGEVTASFGKPTYIDGWDACEGLRYTAPVQPGGRTVQCICIFYFDLLQEVKLVADKSEL